MNINDFDMINSMFNAEQTINNPVEQPMKLRLEEFTVAKAAVPMITGQLYLTGITNVWPVMQISSCAMFCTMFNLNDWTTEEFVAEYQHNLEYYHARNRDKRTDLQTDYELLMNPIEILVDMRFITVEDGIVYTTPKFEELTLVRAATAPLNAGDERRVPYIKGDKVDPSPLTKESLDYQQTTLYGKNEHMFEIVKQAHVGLKVKAGTKRMLAGCALMSGNDYCTEIDADKRIRTYACSFFGPNPQGDDCNRALYELKYGGTVAKHSYEHYFMMRELDEAAKGKKADIMIKESTIIYVANNPVKSLQKLLKEDSVDSPYMYVRLCIDIAEILIKGSTYSSIAFGLDAKCSGTQIYSIITGTRNLMESTGFSDIKVADPYELVARYFPGLTRKDLKPSYMIVQYGGGIRALQGEEATYQAVWMQYPDLTEEQVCRKIIDAVEAVLGDKIIKLRKVIAAAVMRKCEDLGVEYFEYTHIDGAVINNPVCDSVVMTTGYTSIRYAEKLVIDFGSHIKQTGLSVSTGVPCKEEFARTFMVNWIQGLDALIARTVATKCKAAGIKGFISIHDCFRVAIHEVHMLKGIIDDAYVHIFVNNNVLEHLAKQLDLSPMALKGIEQVITEEEIRSDKNYYFCQ